MNLPIHLPQRGLFAGIAIGVVVGVLGVSVVTAASPSPASPGTAGSTTAGTTTVGATTAAGAAARPGIRLGALRKAIGNNFRVAVTATNAKGTHDILYVRGSLAVSSDSVMVTLPDNSTQAFSVTSATVVRDSGKTVPFSSLTNGEHAMVFGTKNTDGSYSARLIRTVKTPKAAAPAAANP